MNPVAFFARHALSKSQKDYVNAAVSNYAEFQRTGKWNDRVQFSQTYTRMARLRAANRICEFRVFDPDYQSWVDSLKAKFSPQELSRFQPGGDIYGLTRTVLNGGLIKTPAVADSTIFGAFILTEDGQRVKELLIVGKFRGSSKEETVLRIRQNGPGQSFHTEVGLYAKLFLISL